MPFEACLFWHFSGLIIFSFNFFLVLFYQDLWEQIADFFGFALLDKLCVEYFVIGAFANFVPCTLKIEYFLAVLAKSLLENHASFLFCHFGVHASTYLNLI